MKVCQKNIPFAIENPTGAKIIADYRPVIIKNFEPVVKIFLQWINKYRNFMTNYNGMPAIGSFRIFRKIGKLVS